MHISMLLGLLGSMHRSRWRFVLSMESGFCRWRYCLLSGFCLLTWQLSSLMHHCCCLRFICRQACLSGINLMDWSMDHHDENPRCPWVYCCAIAFSVQSWVLGVL